MISFSPKNKSLFLTVNNTEQFLSRTFVVLSLAKALGGCPGLRSGILYAPDMKIGDNVVSMRAKIATLMLDTTCAVSTPVQYVTECVLKAKLGEGNPEWCTVYNNWEQGILKAYKDSIKLAVQLFTKDAAFSLVVEPEGSFFGFISGAKLMNKKVPHEISLKDGRTVSNLPEKVGSTVFTKDAHISLFLVHAAEVVTIPGNGFAYDETRGCMRVSFAVSCETLEEAFSRLEFCAGQVLSNKGRNTN